jgi:hypothetical protein
MAGGLILLASASRPAALFGAWLAAISGAWFALGPLIGPIWPGHQVSAGTPVGGAITRSLEQIGFFTGLGLAVAFVAAVALGRLTVIAVRDTKVATRAARGEPVTAAPALRDRSARPPTPAGSPGEEPQPEPAGSAAHR